jgi:hypothetical protein
MISITYFFYDETEKTVIAFFTVLNDAIRTDPFKSELPQGKREEGIRLLEEAAAATQYQDMDIMRDLAALR